VQEARVIEGFTGLRKDYRRLELAFHLVKLIGKATYEGLPDNQRLFDLLGNSLRLLESTEKPHLLRLQFELKYLYYLGFLAGDEDTSEFISKPVNAHQTIDLTEDEYLYLNQNTQNLLKNIDLN
jgi:DNA repair protein RecO (recombination protein O)